jgi:hypothetical protein
MNRPAMIDGPSETISERFDTIDLVALANLRSGVSAMSNRSGRQ